MRKAFDWEHSGISMLEVEAVPELYFVSADWFEYCFIHGKFLHLSIKGFVTIPS
jgi:predicted Ser/Thr protein kinase